MAIDILTLALARSYTKSSLVGLGALRGANCTIKSIVDTPNGSTVTFEWTGNDGSVQTSQLNIENGTDGKDGSSVTNLEIRQVGTDYHLLCTITDADGNEQEIDAGILPSVGGTNITTDETPTQGSQNPVESGGVFDALELKQDKLTGNDGQLVGFDAQGNAIAVDAPETGVTEFNGRKGVVLPEVGDYTADMIGADPVGSAAQALVDANTYTDEKIAEVNVLPVGGIAGQVLAKMSEVDGDAEWRDIDTENVNEISKADYELIPDDARQGHVYYIYDEDNDEETILDVSDYYNKTEVDEKDAKAIKKVYLDQTTRTIRFYRDENGNTAVDGDFNIAIPDDVDTSNLVEKIPNATDGNIVVSDVHGGIVDGGIKLSDLATITNVTELNTKIGSLADLNTTEKTSVINAINEIDTIVNTLKTDSSVVIEEDTTNPNFAKVYTFKQNNVVIGSVNIPKDMLVQSGQIVEDPVGHPIGKYIELTIANNTGDKIYINIADLVDAYTAQQNATQIQLTISNTNEISAAIVANSITNNELANGSVTTDKILDANITSDKLAEDVKLLFDSAGSADLAEKNAKEYADRLVQANPGGNGQTTQTYTDEEVNQAVDLVLYGNNVDGGDGD